MKQNNNDLQDRPDLQIISQWIEPGARILDLGCGDGTLLAYLQREKQVSGYGLEIDPDNIAECIRKDVNVIQIDLDKEGLEIFADNRFDYVVMTQSLQTMHVPDRLLDEMLRIGQQAVISFPNMGHWKSRFYLGLLGQMPKTRALPHEWYNTPNIHLCTLHDFEQLCEQHNAKVLKRAVLDNRHRSTLRTRLLPNLFGQIALYRFQKNR